jgi:hypothetical protein
MINLIVCVSSHQKFKCIYECCNVEIMYSWGLDFLMWQSYYSNPIIINNFMETLITDCWFENTLSPHFPIEISYQDLQVVLRELNKNMLSSTQELSFASSLLSQVGAHTFRIIISHQQPLKCYIWHPVTNKFYPSNYWYDSLVYEKVCP